MSLRQSSMRLYDSYVFVRRLMWAALAVFAAAAYGVYRQAGSHNAAAYRKAHPGQAAAAFHAVSPGMMHFLAVAFVAVLVLALVSEALRNAFGRLARIAMDSASMDDLTDRDERARDRMARAFQRRQ